MPVPSAARTSGTEHRRRGSRLGVAGIGRVYLCNGGSLWIGHSAGQGKLHRHHAIRITLPLDGCARLRGALDASWSDYEGAVVMSEQPHQFDGCGLSIAQIFVEPETAAGTVLRARFGDRAITALPRQRVAALVGPLFSRFESTRDDAPMRDGAAAALASLLGPQGAAPRNDERFVRVKALLREQAATPPTPTQLAEAAHLSPSRLRHLFVAQTGSSFRAYRPWLRPHEAPAEFNRGENGTQAAHTAGFAGSAHLSRIFRRMFGILPVMLIRE